MAPLENTIKLKIEFSLIIKYTSQAVNSFQDSFYLQLVSIIFHSSHTPQTVQIPLQAHLNSTPRTNERERERAPPHISSRSAVVFPSASVSFLPFLLLSHSTSPPPTSSFACTRSIEPELSLMPPTRL